MDKTHGSETKAALLPDMEGIFPDSSKRIESYLYACPDRLAPSGLSKGFSIFEALIVVAVLSLAGAIAIPHLISWRSNMRLLSAVRELRGNLETAKALAAKENTTITLQFEPASGQYRITFRDVDDTIVAIKAEQLPPRSELTPRTLDTR